MSYNSWSLGRGGTVYGGGWGGAGGGGVGGGSGERQRDEAIFAKLQPVNGKVSGVQVKTVFQTSGLTQQQLAQIWRMVDQDGDGQINVSEFCSAMSMIRQAKVQQQQTMSLNWPAGSTGGMALPSLQPTLSLPVDSSQKLAKSPSVPILKDQTSLIAQQPQMGGVGRGVSLTTVNAGWAMNALEKRRYVMEFNTYDRVKTGFLSGAQVRPILSKSGLEQSVLAQIWELSDSDNDGRLSVEEFAVAMHLIEKAKKGLSLPHTLPTELSPTSVQKQRKKSEGIAAPTPTDEQMKTFEDKRKENFDAGKMELQRRRRSIQEKQDREEAEKERKKRQEEEIMRQQKLEAERRRRAELERQNRIALEIQKERERQMAKLVQQREAEQREMERKRKEEWARKRQVELEGVKEWEMKALRALQSQHSNLENELQQLDQEKVASSDSVSRQSSLCDSLRGALRTMRLSAEVKRAVMTKLKTELQGLQSRLASLGTQRKQLQESLQTRSPQSLQYQRERQVYQDGIMGVAAMLAGLRSTLKSGEESYQKQQELFSNNSLTLTEMKTELQRETAKVTSLESQVAHQRSLWEERQKRAREVEQRRHAAEVSAREERAREEKEARMERIRREQEQAIRQAKEQRKQQEKEKEAAELNKLMTKGTVSPPPQATPTLQPTTPTTKTNQFPLRPAPYQPSPVNAAVKKLAALLQEADASKKDEKAKEKEVKKKRPPPAKPTPYGGKKQKKNSSSSSPLHVPPLLDFESTWDSSAQNSSFVPNPKSSFNPLQPQRAGLKVSESDSLVSDREIGQPDSQSGQGSIGTRQSSPPPEVEALYSVVRKPRTATRTNLDHSTRNQLTPAGQSSTTSPPPKDWVVISSETAAVGGSSTDTDTRTATTAPPIPAARNKRISSNTSDQVFLPSNTQPVTSTPIRATDVPSTCPPSNPSTSALIPSLSSSWADISPLESGGKSADVHAPPGPTQHQEVTAAVSSVVVVKYRALYSFDAESDSEVSLNEGDIVNGIPGELPSNGWLMVEVRGQRGLVPESYLERVESGGEGVTGRSEDVKGGSEGVTGRSEDVKAGSEGVTGGSDLGRASMERDMETAPQEPAGPQEKVKVRFSWKGSKDNHLSIKKGDVIWIIQKGEKWWSGEIEGRVGWFPKTFVELLKEETEPEPEPEGGKKEVHQPSSTITEPPVVANKLPRPPLSTSAAPITSHAPSIEKTTPIPVTSLAAGNAAEQLYKALYDYDSKEPGDLLFKTGDIIQVTSKDGEWWNGSLNGKSGTFPSNYVQPHSPSSSENARPSSPPVPPSPSISLSSITSDVPVTTHTKPLVARVTQEYKARKDNQLNLTAGQYIKVSKQQAATGWWYGELQSRGKQRQIGWFPAANVALLQKKEGGSTSTPPPSSSSASSITSTAAAATGSGATGQTGMPTVLGGQRARSPLIDILDPQDSHSLSQNLVLALYTYTAVSSDELSFHKGSVITVLVKKGQWWKGELNGMVGLFPCNYVQPLNEQMPAVEATRWAESVSPDVLASVSKMERKRQEAIFELLSSERNYTDSLKFVREVFFEPMEASAVLTEEEMSKVRVNWDELIQCNSNMLNAFLVRLRTSGSIVKNLGDILHSQIPLLTPHIRWCSCQLTACTLLQSKSSDPLFKEFEQKCAQDPRAAGLPLSSFLLKPMQRITKYPLLIQRIIDFTTEDHMDQADLKGALHEAEELCRHVNEAVRSKENTEHQEWLQSHVQFSLDENLVFNSQTNFMGQRKLLHWGKLFKIRGNRDLVGFLFNDFFLLVKPKHFFSRAATPAELEPFGKNEFTMYRTPYLLGDITVSKASSEQHGPSVFLMNYPSEEKDIPLKSDSDPARDVWIKMVQEAKREYLKTKRKQELEMKKKWQQTLKHTVGVLKVTVVKADDLKASDPNGKSDPFCVLSFSQQEENTPVINNNLNPRWNYNVNFAVHDLNQDVLEITVFDKDLFSPNDFLGCCRVALKDLLQEGDSPWQKQLLLEDVQKGELELVIELTLNKSDLLL